MEDDAQPFHSRLRSPGGGRTDMDIASLGRRDRAAQLIEALMMHKALLREQWTAYDVVDVLTDHELFRLEDDAPHSEG